ncbi:MAG: hypothetical protein HYX38_06875 [Rhodospirillales bacterium]|nr:hypothetical protein [Rhodospirillales bacterium]
MASESNTDTEQSSAPGTLEKFHLGLADDGMTCALLFVDEHHRSIARSTTAVHAHAARCIGGRR